MVTIRSPCCGCNLAWCVEIIGEDLWSCSHIKNWISLRKCPYDHWLTNKAYLSAITVTGIFRSFTYKMAPKTGWHRYGTKLRHCHPMYISARSGYCTELCSALQHHLSGTLSLSPFRTVTRLHYLNLDLKHICSPPSMLLNCPVRQRLWSHGNMAIYKFCIVLYYCIINLELSGFVRFLACRLEHATAQLSAPSCRSCSRATSCRSRSWTLSVINWPKVRTSTVVSNKCIAVRRVVTPLRELACHMGPHSVTCHPAEVTFPPLPQPKLVLD